MRVFIFLLIGIFSIACKQTIHIAQVASSNITVGSGEDGLKANEDILATIAPYKEEMEKEMTRTIGVIGSDMQKKKPESSLTNWLGDVLYRQSILISGMEVDFALMNFGGIRLPALPKGPITVGKVYELMPFDNFIVIVEIPGQSVLELFDMIAKSGGGWPLSEQVFLSISGENVEQILIKGQEVDPKGIYKIATSNFLADGGDKSTMLMNHPRFEFDEMIRDLIVKDIEEMTRKGAEVSAPESGRMKYK